MHHSTLAGIRQSRITGRGHFFSLGFLLAMSLACVMPIFAQIADPADQTKPADEVYVRDSAVVSEKVALAERLERLNEWGKAADVYQELLHKYFDRVMLVDQDATRTGQYTNVTACVQSHLAKWPKEAVEIYRARFEVEAAAKLEQAGSNPAALQGIIDHYFISSAASDAGMRLINIDLENGDFSAAAWLGDRLLLAVLAESESKRPILLYRTAIAHHLAGNDDAAKRLANELSASFPNAKAVIEGKTVTLADSLSEHLKSTELITKQTRDDSWPMPFGSLDHARIPKVPGFGDARIFSTELTGQTISTVTDPQQPDKQKVEIARDRESGLMTGIVPVVDRGELFFQDNAHIYAVSLDSGLPRPGWAATYDGDRGGKYSIAAWSTPRDLPYTVTVTDDAVLAIMGQTDAPSIQGGQLQRDVRLVCLDRGTGKEKWVMRSGQLPGESLQHLEVNGTPLVAGNNIFVTAHSIDAARFQDCYLVCLDLTGHFRFASYIASANSGQTPFETEIDNTSAAATQLAYSNGRVFVLTNLGAMAAVNAYDGSIAWLNIYPKQLSPNRHAFGAVQPVAEEPGPPSAGDRSWLVSPVIVSDDKVFVYPTDCKAIFVYDAGTGAEYKRLDPAHLYGASTIVGVVGDEIVLAGTIASGKSQQVHALCLNWRNYDRSSYSDHDEKVVIWKTPYTSPERNENDGLRGRGFLTTDALFLPTQRRLLKIDLRNGSLATYPSGNRAWDDSETSGNVLVTADHLIVAGPEKLSAYTDINLAMAKLDKEVAAAPNDPQSRLHYAEVMFVAGKFDLAVAKLDEAIKVIGGLKDKSADLAARERIYICALTFAEKLSHASDNANLTTGLYDRAGLAASSAQQQVNYRISRATFEMKQHVDDAELALLQEILADSTWRVLAVASQAKSSGSAPAAVVAENMIDDLIKRSPKLYEPVQAEAQQAFDAAQAKAHPAKADPAKLLSVAQTYPNARKIAADALLKAADAYEAVGNTRQAIEILRQLYFKQINPADRAIVVESLARNYLATPNHVDVAIARLAQGVKLPNHPALTRPMVLPDGTILKDVGFEDALAALKKYRQNATAVALPDFGLPLTTSGGNSKAFMPAGAPVATGITTIIPPVANHGRNDRIVTFSPNNGVVAYCVGSEHSCAASKAISDAPIGCAWLGESLVVWSKSKIAMLKGDDSEQLAWQCSLHDIPTIELAANDQTEPVAVGNNGNRIVFQGNGRIIVGRNFRRGINPVFRQFQGPNQPARGAEAIDKTCLVSDRLIFSTTGGRIAALDLSNGKLVWQTRPFNGTMARLLATDDFVVGQFNDIAHARVEAFDTFSGQSVARRNFPADGNTLINLELAPEGKLIYLLPESVECKDLFELDQQLTFAIKVSPGNAGAFIGAIQPEQLIVNDGRIIALSDNGSFARVYSLEDGTTLHASGTAVNNPVDKNTGLQTKAGDWQVRIMPVGSRIYAIGSRTVAAYNLSNLNDSWSSTLYNDDVAKDAMVGKDFLLIVAGAGSAGNQAQQSTSLAVEAYSRELLDRGVESGLLVHRQIISNPTGIQSWQAADGGIYYLSGDHKLYFLKGARKAN